ncbi:LPXTG cell wall anchor domain-containing protein [Brevibacterium aurantiacum]|uniref:LPXTG-motif cell wall anchor domain-containing protein n=1 Tax=Brevibacterium aurantiacum TaxID=273384 RepID=A0A2H1IA13_BREAU|nr:LPXTG cell wall anchor domain-containing protein [Brevibacterium aurantiacum]SMX71872.1 LPXTG-motif cell wall anchor domain-containing protein [Brevibacterium aurantiacum]
MQKKLVQSSLALTAAAALGLGGAFVASPALADGPQKLNVQSDTQIQKALSDVEGVNAYGAKGGKLNIGVAEKTDAIKDLEKKYDNVVVTEGIKEMKPYAANDIVGGAGYLVQSGSSAGACSTGFSGWDGAGNPVVLTAGHCAKIIEKSGEFSGDSIVDETEQPSTAAANGGDGFVRSGQGVLGQWGYHKFGGDLVAPDDPTAQPNDDDIDFAVINVDKSKYNVKTGVTDWSTADSDDLGAKLATDITKVGPHTEGTVQKSGRTTGLTESPVWTDLNDQYTFMNIGGRFVHGFGVKASTDDPFSAGGDSGGGVFQGDTAVGVISGGGPVEQGGVTYDMSWVADLDYSLETAGFDFQLTDPNEEPPGDDDASADAGADAKDADSDAGADAKDADSDAGADAKDADSDAGADAKDADADAGADAKDADADAGADAKDADADAGADAKDADADAGADAKDADADAGADAKDADADAGADAKDANADSDADAPEAPQAPVVEDQKVDEGGQITGKTEANAKVKLDWKPVAAKGEPAALQAQAAVEGTVTVTADAEGNFTAEAPSEAGTYAYTATATTAAGTSDPTEFTVTVEADDAADEADAGAEGAEADADGNDSDAGAAADAKDAESNADSDGSKDGEAPEERKLSIEPKEVSASDFVKQDKGVQILAAGFEEGEKVSLEVVAGPENVEGITLDETANADGVAAFSIYGTSASDPSVYLGKYNVEVTGANDTEDESALTGSFEVVADEDGNGGGGNDDGDNGNNDDDGNGDGGSDLPRTGAELTGLAAGAGLLVVGGAAVVLTMRRKKNN